MAFESSSCASCAEVLAWKSSGEDVGMLPLATAGGPALIVSVSATSLNCDGCLLYLLGKLTICEFDDISKVRDSWPVPGEYSALVWLNFAEADRLDSRSFKSKIHPSYAREERCVR